MANPEHLALLKQGVRAWNEWRQANLPIITPGLCEADLRKVDLHEANLRGANLYGANLHGANLGRAHLSGADLSGADLSWATLFEADLSGANLSRADLFEADLRWAILRWADLRWADLSNVVLGRTIFGGSHLVEAKGLDTCIHHSPSILDYETLQHSGPLAFAFLRGCGLPDLLIDFLPSLLNQPIQYYSCFISYSCKDEGFAQRLYADLQSKGVRCWFAPEDIQGGRKIYEQLSEAIRLYEKLLLVLSEHSMSSKWVRVEIDKARQREEREKRQVLFPIRLVDYETIEQWECFSAHEIREYFIPDFSNWENHDAYQPAFDRLLRDLKPALERKPEAT